MSDWIIKATGLGKRYRIRHQQQRQRYVALRDVLAQKAKSAVRGLLFRGPSASGPSTEDFWALKDVSFEIKQGEAVGIIGRNGAGKSTLLKILSQITEPTEGRVTLRGRVASLLEVGTGFHPELTGRGNIFLNGAMLGMTRAEIRRKFDEIVAFAEVETFLDTPVKRYSSGMYVRLAFAVAAHLEPEILVVDEVLAVGDARFQKKCLGKMGEVAKGGRTVLFVSHNMGMVSKLCQTGMLLDLGRLLRIGGIDEVIQGYLAAGQNAQSNRYVAPAASGQFVVHILKAETVNAKGEGTTEFGHEDSVVLKIACALNCPDPATLESIRLTVALVDGMGRRVFTNQTSLARDYSSLTGFNASMGIPSGLLTPGNYTFIINANIPPSEILSRVEDACPFFITDLGSEFAMFKGGDFGCVFAKCDWRLTPAACDPVSIP